jgi:1-acyl-sn-glycerol-3-phosphate acyltransferase
MTAATATVEAEVRARPSGWGRRLLTTPTLFAFALSSIFFLLPSLLLALLWDTLGRTRLSACRTVLFLTSFVWFETIGLAVLFWHWIRRMALGLDDRAYEKANRQLQQWWVRRVYAAVTRLFDVRIDVDGSDSLNAPAPSVVLARHASTLDTLLPMALSGPEKRLRYVLKAELLLDPALDYCGQRLPNAFVARGSAHPEREVEKVVNLGRNLGNDDAVVLYPEGTRFTHGKRRRLLEKYADDPEMYALVESFRATLPPVREGALQLLRTTPSADVVFIAHRGLTGATTMKDLLSGKLTQAHVEVLIWRVPAGEVPREEQALRSFLLDQWQRVDRFADESLPVPT